MSELHNNWTDFHSGATPPLWWDDRLDGLVRYMARSEAKHKTTYELISLYHTHSKQRRPWYFRSPEMYVRAVIRDASTNQLIRLYWTAREKVGWGTGWKRA